MSDDLVTWNRRPIPSGWQAVLFTMASHSIGDAMRDALRAVMPFLGVALGLISLGCLIVAVNRLYDTRPTGRVR